MSHIAAVAEPLPDRLRDAVLAGEFPPGSTVTESSVALQFQVARPTARLAIERLVAEGMLRRQANRAARVPTMTADEIRDVYDTRILVEVEAVRRLALEGAPSAATLNAHRALSACQSGDPSVAGLDIAFHRGLVAAQRSPRLTRLHHDLMGEVGLCIAQVQSLALMSVTDIASQHADILAAVFAGQADEAAERTRDHLCGARDCLAAAAERHTPKG